MKIAVIALKHEKIGPTFLSFNPCQASLPSVAKDDRMNSSLLHHISSQGIGLSSVTKGCQNKSIIAGVSICFRVAANSGKLGGCDNRDCLLRADCYDQSVAGDIQ